MLLRKLMQEREMGGGGTAILNKAVISERVIFQQRPGA